MLLIANSVNVDTNFGRIPKEIRILPTGTIQSEKGNFIVDKDSFLSMKREMEQRGVDIVIDYEHQTLEGVQAPAGGWIKDLIYTPEAIVAKVEWTPKAKDYLKNKEYRYLSPVVLTGKKDRKAKVLHSVALTNTPAIHSMFPIINSVSINSEYAADEEDVDEYQQEEIDQANQTECKNAEELDINKIKEMLGLPASATAEEIMNELDLQLKATEKQAHKFKIDSLIDSALKDGKILPYQKDDMRRYAEADFDGFNAYINKSPQIVPVGKMNLIDAPKNGSIGYVDEETKKICSALDISVEDYQKYNT